MKKSPSLTGINQAVEATGGIPRNTSLERLDDLTGVEVQESKETQVPSANDVNDTHLNHFAVTLANRHRILPTTGKTVLIQRLNDNVVVLNQAQDLIQEAVMMSRRISSAEEWLIDNFWMINEQIHMAKKHLPPGYSKEMPKLANTELAGLPRIYGMVLDLISLVNAQINQDNIYQFVHSYQNVVPLTIGELWGIPIMLRLGLLENIRRVADEIISMRRDRNNADVWADKLLEAADVSSKSVVQVLFNMSQSDVKISNAFVLQILQRLQGSDPLLSVITTWLEQNLSTQGLDVDDINRSERHANHVNLIRLRNSIISLRFVNVYSWKEFVEELSYIESILSNDPSGIYSSQDFETRDGCRHVIERLAMQNKVPEQEIAKAIIELASDSKKKLDEEMKDASEYERDIQRQKSHVGYYLLKPEGLLQLKEYKSYRVSFMERLSKKYNVNMPVISFLGSVSVISLLFSMFVLSVFYGYLGTEVLNVGSVTSLIGSLLLIICSLLVGSQLGVSITNLIITHVSKPSLLPRIDFTEKGVPDEFRTMVVVPTMLGSVAGVKELIEDLRARYLVNRDKNIYYALITDFLDCKTETSPNDEALLREAVKGVEELNHLYPNIDGSVKSTFFLFHRTRLFNEKEGVWMGWERKRGKLTQFTNLLRGGPKEVFQTIIGDTSVLTSIQFVITLDTDTMLPADAARKLIGNASHILNKPVINSNGDRVVSGYGLLQPRVSVGLTGAYKSYYALVNSLDSGIDPYTKYVSDVYQDAFGEGSFIGKGLYHVDAFHKVFSDRFPENRILSHDLLEGCYVRSGLVTDVELIEEYPSSYLTEASRRHRWVRGDWQIASWVLPFVPSVNGLSKNPLSVLSKWKIFDNLRRSLVPSAMTILMLFGMLFGVYDSILPIFSVLAVLSVFVIPMIIETIEDIIFIPEEITLKLHMQNVWFSIMRRLIDLAINFIFMPFEAYNNLDAILRCLCRIYFTRKLLLQWTTSTSAASAFSTNQFMKMMTHLWFAPAISISLLLFLMLSLFKSGFQATANLMLFYNLGVLTTLAIIWLAAPLIGYILSKPLESAREIEESPKDLDKSQIAFLRRLSRKTWRFFETFVRLEDNWLPLDNFQEFPRPMYARRTSPTNIAMALLTNIAAWDFGYITNAVCMDRCKKTLETMLKMERYKGHLYNWYDTSDLRPLSPKYVSSVDSGNLVGYLVLLNTALLQLVDQAILPSKLFTTGIQDNILCMKELLERKDDEEEEEEEIESTLDISTINDLLSQIEAKLGTAPDLLDIPTWIDSMQPQIKQICDILEKFLEKHINQVEELPDDIPIERVETKEMLLLFYAESIDRQLLNIRAEVNELLPWIAIIRNIPEEITKSENDGIVDLMKNIKELSKETTLRDVANLSKRFASSLSLLKSIFKSNQNAYSWLEKLDHAITTSSKNADRRISRLREVADMADQLSNQDFTFLYNTSRNLLSIGYNVDHKRLDNAYYDTFCSEARLCSFVCIAKGQFPVKHWFSMSRLLTTHNKKPTLLSWSGSMFEYLMPLLVMPSIPGTLLDQTYYSIVQRQIQYGKQKKVPWGISESAYNMMDASLIYQYGPFGVPGLGLKRGLSNDLVVSPYSSALALMLFPVQACKNLKTLSDLGMQGNFGMYEAVDFTPHRLRGHMTSQPIRSFFAHHEGMSFLALSYTLLGQPMQKRFEKTPILHANELLLQEKIPRLPHMSNPNEKETSRWMNENFNAPSANRRYFGPQNSNAPDVHLLSNADLHVMVSVNGGGYINYKDIAVTRWREDSTLDGYAVSCYLRDLDTFKYWTATSTPMVAPNDSNYSVMFSQGKAEFKRTENNLLSHTTITVSPYDDVEVRRVTLTNNSDSKRKIEATSYGEIVLGSSRLDAVHRSFSTLFVKSEILPEYNAIVYFRKPRSSKEKTYYAFHIMLLHESRCASGSPSFETDRNKFIGRGHDMENPICMDKNITSLMNTSGYPLDPVFAIRQALILGSRSSVSIDYITGVASSMEQALKIIQKYQRRRFTNYVINYSWISSQKLDFRLGITAVESQMFGKLAGCLLYSNPRYRASSRLIAKNRHSQTGLWRLGISGDHSIILVRIGDVQNIELIAQLLQAHTYFRANGLMCDLVIWNDETSSYRDDLQSTLLSLIASSAETSQRLEVPGGIYPVRGERLTEHEGILLYSVARVVLSDTGGRLVDQINRKPAKEFDIPQLVPLDPNPTYTISDEDESRFQVPEISKRDLLLPNEYGGFDRKYREYVIEVKNGVTTPSPWVNILANEQFGTVISERGSSYTWFENAHEYRLTPWNNDTVIDNSGEAYYIRDEECGKFWSPMPQPATGDGVYICRHGMGYSSWEHVEDGIRTDTTVFVPQNEPVKIVFINIRNFSGKTRNLSVTGFVEWTLGELRDRTYPNIVTDIENGTYASAIIAKNPYHLDFSGYAAFFSVIGHKCTITGNRSEFIGFNGTLGSPASMHRTNLSGSVGAAMDPCGAIHVPIVIEHGKNIEISFVLGAQKSHNQAKDLIERIRSNLIVRQLLKNVKAFWNHTLNTIQIQTPDPSLDVLANGWLMYQVLSSRIWGRSGFYQSSGAFGFRDQLQDSMSLYHTLPDVLKQQIITCCEHQFEKGDVCHWWHPQSNRGVRTSFSDDYLWLALAVAHYVTTTGDYEFLNHDVRFASGIELPENEESRFDQVHFSDMSAPVYEHCKRSIKYGMKYGSHGIPLMGCGDWNDGMNLVGIDGKGESVWLAFFLYFVMKQFEPMAKTQNDDQFIQLMHQHQEMLKQNIEKNTWDGDWYLRAFFDNGEPLGSKDGPECKIDSLPQSWGIISGVADKKRSMVALESAYKHLVRPDLSLIQLFDPPFDKSHLEPGYIKGYAPGVRENGGQYTHAAIWLTWAFSMQRDQRAWKLFDIINPVNHSKDSTALHNYKVEPYVVAADVYTLKGHEGQGGWTWYTGSAGWMYRLIIEQLIGLCKVGNSLRFKPHPRKDWNEFKVIYRHMRTSYHITFKMVDVPAPSTDDFVKEMQLDGEPADVSQGLKLEDDQKEHHVVVNLYKV